MKRKYFIATIVTILLYGCSDGKAMPAETNLLTDIIAETVDCSLSAGPDNIPELYDHLGLKPHVGFEAFEQAVSGYGKISSRNKDVLTLVDFSKPSTEERLFVIDMSRKELLFKTHVSHGKNSGENYATSFSNVSGSYKSSLGFYLTENTYQGRNGYSLVLAGLEKGINDKAKSRAIVIHGAAYANPSVIGKSGRLGRSLGCPALPTSVSKDIIDTIKDGSVLFIYAGKEDYTASSSILS